MPPHFVHPMLEIRHWSASRPENMRTPACGRRPPSPCGGGPAGRPVEASRPPRAIGGRAGRSRPHRRGARARVPRRSGDGRGAGIRSAGSRRRHARECAAPGALVEAFARRVRSRPPRAIEAGEADRCAPPVAGCGVRAGQGAGSRPARPRPSSRRAGRAGAAVGIGLRLRLRRRLRFEFFAPPRRVQVLEGVEEFGLSPVRLAAHEHREPDPGLRRLRAFRRVRAPTLNRSQSNHAPPRARSLVGAQALPRPWRIGALASRRGHWSPVC